MRRWSPGRHGVVIPTRAMGHRFRSRLEARWAVFLDTLRVEYRYEPHRFELGDVSYLPDFHLPGLGVWIEVKGPEPIAEEIAAAKLLAAHTSAPVIIAVGEPFFGRLDVYTPAGERMNGSWAVAANLSPCIQTTRALAPGVGPVGGYSPVLRKAATHARNAYFPQRTA